MLFYKRLLVISDNLILAEAFNNVLQSKPIINELSIVFKHSPLSNTGLLQSLTKSSDPEVDVINLKDDKNIENVISSYDIVFSIHCKQLFPESLFQHIKCINIHP